MEKITTHVLDTASGIPAAGVRIRLLKDGVVLADSRTNADGRCDGPLVSNPEAGAYQLVFSIGAYFRKRGIESPFLDEVPIHFCTTAGQSYHIPLLVSPWSYSTYRGS
jgi:5-hydroxyisourate hydrolase